jgi:hypothetical protein
LIFALRAWLIQVYLAGPSEGSCFGGLSSPRGEACGFTVPPPARRVGLRAPPAQDPSDYP